jgi:hypothetical protein
METFSIPMALEDYVPVILTGFALFILARMIARMDRACGPMAFLGAALIVAGGLSKATWKLIMATSEGQNNFGVLDDALFLLLAPGFIFFGFALAYAQRGSYVGKRPKNIWLAPVILVALTMGVVVLMSSLLYDPERERQTWYFIVLGMTTVFNVIVAGLCIWQARREKVMLAAGFFLLNIILVFVLQGMARAASESVGLQWGAQIVNTLSNAALLFASWKLAQVTVAGLAKRSEPQLAAA